ncbi:efflux RND transporter permease subunit [Saccharicrinis fermentans]|uniref:Multidrug transporter MdtC n=1 Tax=Saccharicrinis fermentans DSM 9555 = JCM 21142 TaxID=869213 RepID=W7YJ03_9BACT|nr:efflux RND transporter permease subunit [Saccharicrinis fermentans]GAF02514.1 multidrug transporter MdtC [Saccharicrinis fermentans DSM 9555 = JCM 21142]
MKKLIAYFIKFPLAVNLLMVMVFLFGIIALLNTQKNFFPNIPTRNIYVDIVYPGASPEEVEEGAILKIEENVKGLENMERITSVSRENMGTVTIEMLKGTDMDEALTRVKNEVEKISSFPVNIESVVTYKHDNTNFAINFAIVAKGGNKVTLNQLKLAARDIEHDLLRMDGISKISIGGYPDEEIAILLDEEAMESYQISFTEIANAVKASNLLMTGGSIKDGAEEFFIRVRNKEYRSEGLEDIVVRNSSDGGIVYLKDIATIKDMWDDSPSDIVYNKKQAVVVTINTTFEEDIIVASEKLNAYLDDYNKSQDLFETEIIRDQSDTLNQRIELLMNNGLLGILLVLLFLSLFLNPRIAFWVAIGIPFSMLGMFVMIPATTVTINMLSLFGLILVLGILVDDAIVVGENIYRHWQMGKSPVQAAIEGTLEVTAAVVSGVITTITAFCTFLFLDGRLGEMFSEVSVIVIIILLVSLVEGLIVLPAHMAHSKALVRGSDKKWIQYMGWSEAWLVWMRNKIYSPILSFFIKNKIIAFSVFIATFIFSILAVSNKVVTTTFFPDVDGDNFTVTLTMPSGTDTPVTQKHLDRISAGIWEVNEEMKGLQPEGQDIIKSLYQQYQGAGNSATIEVSLLDAEVRNSSTAEVIEHIRSKVGEVPGAETFEIIGFNPFGKALSLSLVGDDNKALQAAKEEVKLALKKMPELSDVSDNSPVGSREIELSLKPKAHHLGITLQQVIGQVREAFFGNEVQRLQRGKDEVRVWVRYDIENRRSLGQLENMKIRLGNGVNYPLAELASFKMVNGVTNVRHLQFDREVQVVANQTDPTSSLPEIMQKINKEILPPIFAKHHGVRVSYDGQQRETNKVASSASVVIPVVLLLMFGMVILTTRSVSQSILVYAMIPLSLFGVVMGHWIHGQAISLMSFMGMIALVGVMINDGLILVNALNVNLKNGMPYYDAVVDAGISRFRPIILTTLTTVAGMAPMVLETSLQAQFLIPMALSLAYGMAMATTTTLFLLPVMLLIVNQLKVKWVSLIKGRTVSAEEVENAIKEMKYDYDKL